MGLRNFQRPFRGMSKWHLASYLAMFDWGNNLERSTYGFQATLLGRLRPTVPGP